MILNSKSNQFVFNLPNDFIFDEISKKYDPYIKKLYTPFNNTIDYLNHTIQSVSLPNLNIDVVEQNVGPIRYTENINDSDNTKLTKNEMRYRDSDDLRNVVKDLSITFKLTDSYLNYWILFENLMMFNDVSNTKDYFSDFIINFLNREGYIVLNVEFKMPVLLSISDVELSYSQVAIEFKTFTMGFVYNNININLFDEDKINKKI